MCKKKLARRVKVPYEFRWSPDLITNTFNIISNNLTSDCFNFQVESADHVRQAPKLFQVQHAVKQSIADAVIC